MKIKLLSFLLFIFLNANGEGTIKQLYIYLTMKTLAVENITKEDLINNKKTYHFPCGVKTAIIKDCKQFRNVNSGLQRDALKYVNYHLYNFNRHHFYDSKTGQIICLDNIKHTVKFDAGEIIINLEKK